MNTIHSQSPVYSTTKEAGKEIISIYDLKYEIVETTYIRKEHGRLTARIKLKTTKINGPEFKDNVLDQIYIFHKENDKWKIWNTQTVSINYL